MSSLMSCGICCMLTSGWGVIQLFIMGFLFYFEVPILFEECEAEEYGDYDDFIKKTKHNYRAVAYNCWIASAMYIVTLILSCLCMKKAQKDATTLAKLREDDDYICNPPPPKTKKEKACPGQCHQKANNENKL